MRCKSTFCVRTTPGSVHHSSCTKAHNTTPPNLESIQTVDDFTANHHHNTSSSGHRISCTPVCSSSNSTTPNPTCQEMLALQTPPESRDPRAQESESKEEIFPGVIKYRLGPLLKSPLHLQRPCYPHKPGSQYKPPWRPFRSTRGEYSKPWQTEPVTYPGEETSHSGNYYVATTHQISFQNPPLGQLITPIHIQGRKIAPREQPGNMECINQYQRDSQAHECSQVLQHDPDKNKCLNLPPPKTLVGVQAKSLSSTLRALKAKFQTETTSKQSFKDGGTQPQVCSEDPHNRGYKNFLGMGSQVPDEDQTTTRTTYLPLFSQRVNLCKPKVVSIKRKAKRPPLLNKGKH
ncbi:uncharacterized protein LOC119240699 isoform X2 [Talpa occidentalis]|uniref:uncharacterized protein LOC119240699 isoform X2 n=1 Tax=Talpa occidentalis TaxID=50954 RepID=UPI00188E6CC8|nr:uncharacterized protein LOC119240699 isoform X2 [Talpa occidentalis]